MPHHEMTDEEKVLHELIIEAEKLARLIRVGSSGNLSLAVVNNHGRTLKEREGMNWHEAHSAADRIFALPAEPPTDLDLVAKEMFPVAYAAITDDEGMDPKLLAEAKAESDRRKQAKVPPSSRAGGGHLVDIEEPGNG